MSKKQTTLKKEIFFEGIGVHSGTPSSFILKPAAADQGIVIVDAKDKTKSFKIGHVVPEVAMHATVIDYQGWRLSTIEHLMAALGFLDVDNAIIEIDGNEVPILDGSALPFVQGIQQVGLQELNEIKSYITPKNTLLFEGDGKTLVIEPAKHTVNPSGRDTKLHITYKAHFDHPLIGARVFQHKVDKDTFIKELAPARTFGFLSQLPFLRKHGLSQGASLGNTVVIGEEELLNDPRFEDEWVRHKVLDLLGDLTLLGLRLAGSVRAEKTGHSFNRKVIEHFVNHPDEWEVIS